MSVLLVVYLILLTLEFTVDTIADRLDERSFSETLPPEFQGIFDPSRYSLARSYKITNTGFALAQRTTYFIFFISFLLAGGFNLVDQWARAIAPSGASEPVLGVLFAAILSILKLLLNLPFSYFATFKIEGRFGFNKTTHRTFVSDLAKGILLGALLGAPLFAGVVYFFEKLGPRAWLYAWLFMTFVQLLILYIAPAWIMPLFNKFEPLKEGPLKEEILRYMEREHFDLQGVFIMDGSRRSTKANAFFTGFGKLRRLVLFDTLIEKHSTEELVAVLAHEVGHFRRKHILKSIVLSILISGLVFFSLSFLIASPVIADAFGMQSPSIYSSLIFASLLYSPVMKVLSLGTQAISRRQEFEADAFSARTYGKPEALSLALKKLSADSLSNLTPHPLKVLLDYSHPPVLERVRALQVPSSR